MALSNSYEKFGTTFEGAYHRITNLNYTVTEYQETTYPAPTEDENGEPVPAEPVTEWVTSRKAHLEVSTYVNAAARTAHSQPISVQYYEFTPDWSSDDNVLAQAYDHISTLEEFAGSTDC